MPRNPFPFGSYSKNPNLPQAYNEQMQGIYDTYNQSIGSGNVITRHPILSALAGLAAAGPTGALALPLIGRKADLQKQENLRQGFKAAVDAANNTLSSQLPSTQSYGRSKTLESTLLSQGLQSPVDPDTPITETDFKTLLGGLTSDNTLKEGQRTLEGLQKSQYGQNMGFLNSIKALPAATDPLPQGGQLGQWDKGATLQTGVRQQVRNKEPLRQGVYRDPELMKELLGQIGQTQRNTFQHTPAYAKTPSEINENLAQAAQSQSLVKLRELMAQYYPQLVKAQISNYNERPVGPAPFMPAGLSGGDAEALYGLIQARDKALKGTPGGIFGFGSQQGDPQKAEAINAIIQMMHPKGGEPMRLKGEPSGSTSAPAKKTGTYRVGGKAFTF